MQRSLGIEVKDMNKGKVVFCSMDTIANHVYKDTRGNP
jgi:hypothetical protein